LNDDPVEQNSSTMLSFLLQCLANKKRKMPDLHKSLAIGDDSHRIFSVRTRSENFKTHLNCLNTKNRWR
jgi:hypothetical protein